MGQRYEVREVEVHPHAHDSSTFELEDDEHILEAEYRNAHRLVIAIASPGTAQRCMATTADGSRCQNPAQEDSDYCQVPTHGDDE